MSNSQEKIGAIIKAQSGEDAGWFDVDGYSTRARWEGPSSNDRGLDGFTTLAAAIEYAQSTDMDDCYEVVISAWGQHSEYETGDRIWSRHNRPLQIETQGA